MGFRIPTAYPTYPGLPVNRLETATLKCRNGDIGPHIARRVLASHALDLLHIQAGFVPCIPRPFQGKIYHATTSRQLHFFEGGDDNPFAGVIASAVLHLNIEK